MQENKLDYCEAIRWLHTEDFTGVTWLSWKS